MIKPVQVRPLLPLLAIALLTAGCSLTGDVPRPAPTTTTTPAQQALLAYEQYWSVTEAAYAAPSSRDWSVELQNVASGSALRSADEDVRNYAGFPAHIEGTVARAPTVENATDSAVEIADCVELGDSRLIADTTGEVLDDLENRVPRYRFRAEVIQRNGRWLVDRAEPALDEPC